MLEVLPLSQAHRLPVGPGLADVDPDVLLADQMMSAARRAGLDQPPAIVDLAIDELDCEALLDRVPRPMSRGELQLCSLLITLSAPLTELVVVDPTAGLDAHRSRVVAALFETVGDQHAVHVASDAPGFTSHLQWRPLSVGELAALFADAPMRWFVAGGFALELFVGAVYRGHADIDLGLVRSRAPRLRDVLTGWDIQIAAAGTLTTWNDEPLEPARSQNNLWCRPSPDEPFAIDVTLGANTDDEWVYRRDPAIRVPWSSALRHTADGVPYLAPELQLLYKSAAPRPKDDVDADVVIPRLAPDAGAWLRGVLSPDHAWQGLLRQAGAPG